MNFAFDPIWPWSHLTAPAGGSDYGLWGRLLSFGASALLVAIPVALIVLTAWTYLGDPRASRRRVLTVLALRMGAFLFALLAILRPSVAFTDKAQNRTELKIVADASRSMTIQDGFNDLSRWQDVLRILRDCDPVLRRLRDESGVDVAFQRFAADVADFNPDDPGEADGSRTDVGGMLRKLYEERDGRRPLRGLLVLSDGADNGGARNPPLGEAGRWRGIPCPVHTFAVGKETTPDRQNDIALTAIAVEPVPVRVKGKLTTRVTIDAPGFAGTAVRLRLFLDGKEVLARTETLRLSANNEVRLECDAPARPGEVKVAVRVEDPKQEGKPPPGDLNPANNEIATFATVSKEGISVLLVDKWRWERKFIGQALAGDPRMQVEEVLLGGKTAVDPNAAELLQFDRHPYDVIILGDVTAAQLRDLHPQALAGIQNLVKEKAGLLALGGYSTFGNGDWPGTELEEMLPVSLNRGKSRGQIEEPAQMVPSKDGLRLFGYILRLAQGDDAQLMAEWEKLPPLDGISRLDTTGSGFENVLAEAKAGDRPPPILLSKTYGAGRVLAFAGDTTYRWIRSPEGQTAHARFWRQMVVWLARQEDAEGSVWVKPDARRLAVKGDLGFAVGVKGKTGADLKDGTFQVEVVAPDGTRHAVATARGTGDDRGTFTRTDTPGEYRLIVKGEGKDPSTGEKVSGEASARFLVYDDDLELMRRAADHDFLKKLATAGGGQFHLAEELPRFLQQLQNQPLANARAKAEVWPNWRTTTRSPFLPVFFVLFVALLSVEWFLRRRWGMV
jgi:uncharacterized membrane protein